MKTLLDQLKKEAEGEVRDDPITRRAFSVDASIYEIEPIAVFFPKSRADLLLVARFSQEGGLSLIPRGAATGITGGCLGRGLIIDTSKYMNHILNIDPIGKKVRCEPGVVQDQLNAALQPHGLRLGPDTSTGDRATLGGMVANNAAGARSLRFGQMSDHLTGVDLILADGTAFDPESPLAEKLATITDRYAKTIEEHFPHLKRRVSGYDLHALLAGDFPRLIAGSEGTLGMIAEVEMNVVPLLPTTYLALLPFDSFSACFNAVAELLATSPLSLEMIDERILTTGRMAPALRGKLKWLKGTPKALLSVECEDSSAASRLADKYQGQVLNEQQQKEIFSLRKAGLGLLLSKRSYNRAIAFLEDIALPPEHLAPFMERFLALLKRHGKEAGLYGHVGASCLHIRPYIDLRDPSEIKLMKGLMEQTTTLLREYQGVLSGEHGDGLVRSWLNPTLFGKELYNAMEEVKRAFDPENRMNPGKVVGGPPLETDLRLDSKTPIIEPATIFDFSREGGLALAADLCNGNGLCRKQEGLMCPSFQATGDENDTTRARAQVLRAIIHQKKGFDDLSSQKLHDVLDLCLQCKGCKTECPSEVDMAKMKAEALYHYRKKYGTTTLDWLLGHIGPLSPFLRWLPHPPRGFLGLASERALPPFAKERFSTLAKKIAQPDGIPVALMNDTFTEFYCPEVGLAAIKVLNHLGYHVTIIPWRCCGRTLISKGFLKEAKKHAEKLVENLISCDVPLIGLEPSCVLTVLDEYRSFGLAVPTVELFDQFLVGKDIDHVEKKKVLVHGHCHQKALVGMEPTHQVLNDLNWDLSDTEAGCCGMAGSFGYEAEHYALSQRIGELKVFPAVEALADDVLIIASGFSCRTQISDRTGQRAYHLAEVLAMQL